MNSNNEAKSRKPPHSASASEQRQQKKTSTMTMSATDFLNMPSLASSRGKNNSNSVSKSILGKIRGMNKGTAGRGALTNSSLDNAAPSELKAAAAPDSGNSSGNVATAHLSELKIAATAHSNGGTVAAARASALDAATTASSVTKTGAKSIDVLIAGVSSFRTLYFDEPTCKSKPVLVLSKRPSSGKPMVVIAALDTFTHGEISILHLIPIRSTKLHNLNASGRMVPLQNLQDSQGNSVDVLWVVPQQCGNAESILYKGEPHIIPAGKVAKCVDETVLPLQKKINDPRQAQRQFQTSNVTLTATTIGGKSKRLATLPFQRMTSKVLKKNVNDCKLGKTVTGFQYVHTEVVGGEEVTTPKTVDVKVQEHKASDGAIGVTTKLGRMVIPRPHLVIPIDGMPLSSNGKFDFRLSNLQKVSAEYVS